MKKQIFKLGLVASLVMGATTFAHAGTGATVNFTGNIVKATCDVSAGTQQSVDLGSWTKADFATEGELTKSEKHVSLAFSDCTGEDIAKGGVMNLYANAGDQSAVLSSKDLWGDTASGGTNVGIKLTGTQDGGTENEITPQKNSMPIIAAVGDDTPATGLAPTPVDIKAVLSSTAAAVNAGAIKSSIVFSAAYN